MRRLHAVSGLALSFALVLASALARAQAPSVSLALRLGGDHTDRERGLVHLPDGIAVLLDVSYGATDLGGGPLGVEGVLADDIAIARLTHGGTHVWSRRFGSSSAGERGASIATDAAGNFYVAGHYDGGAANLGGAELPLSGPRDGFVASYDASGAHRWSRRFGGDGLDSLNDVVVDGDLVYVVGHTDSGPFDPGTGTAVGPGAIWTLGLGTDGAVRWSARTGESGSAEAVAMTARGPCLVGETVGQAWGQALAGGFVACLARDGSLRFARAIPSASLSDLAVASDGRVFASGTVQGAIPGTSVTSARSDDALLVALDPSGTLLWARSWGGPAEDRAAAIAWDGTRVIGLAEIRAPRGRRIAFGAERFDPGPHSDVALFSVCPADGHDLFALAFGGIDWDRPGDLAVEPDGSLLFGMTFAVDMRAGSGRLRARGEDAAVIRLAPATTTCAP